VQQLEKHIAMSVLKHSQSGLIELAAKYCLNEVALDKLPSDYL